MWLNYQEIMLSRYSSFLRRPYWMFKQNQVGLRYCLLRSLDYTTAIMVVAEIRLMLRRQDNCGLPFFNDNLLSKLIRSTWLLKFVFTLKRRYKPRIHSWLDGWPCVAVRINLENWLRKWLVFRAESPGTKLLRKKDFIGFLWYWTRYTFGDNKSIYIL